MPYTTLEVVQNIIKTSAEAEGYHYECKLNNKDKAKLICLYKCMGFSQTEIAESSDITTSQAGMFLQLCDLCQLSKDEEDEICRLREQYRLKLEDMYETRKHKYTYEQIEDVYNGCNITLTPISTSHANTICVYKKYGVPFVSILDQFLDDYEFAANYKRFMITVLYPRLQLQNRRRHGQPQQQQLQQRQLQQQQQRLQQLHRSL